MNSESEELRCSYSRALNIERSTVGGKRGWARRTFRHLLASAAIIGVTIFTPLESQALAKNGKQVGSQPPTGIDTHAIEMLKMMGTYLRTLQSFQVQADLSTDDVMEDGQIVQSSSKVNLLAAKPNRFRVEVTGVSPFGVNQRTTMLRCRLHLRSLNLSINSLIVTI
jgi:Predicted periplasmic protein (DUF2092)